MSYAERRRSNIKQAGTIAVLSKNGTEIGRIDETWFSESYRSNGWILRNWGFGWERFGHEPHEDIQGCYACVKYDYDNDLEPYKQLRQLVRSLFRLEQLPAVRGFFDRYSGKTERNAPIIGDVESFTANLHSRFGSHIITPEQAGQILKLHYDYRLAWGEGMWAIVVSGGAFDSSTIMEIMVGDKPIRAKRMKYYAELYARSGYARPKVTARPARQSEIHVYLSCGNEIWRKGS